MRAEFYLSLLLAASASAFVEVQTGYHSAIGIALAERIRAAENATLSAMKVDPWQDRIIGGAIAPVNAHPYLAGLLINLVGQVGNSVCGASLVSPNRLVAAAHCWFDGLNQAWQYTVVLGTSWLFSGGTRIATTTVISHPQYIASTLTNDVAMIYLPVNVFYTASIQPINLPTGTELNNAFVGQWAVAAGYGITSDLQTGVTINQVVSHVSLQVITVAQCQSIFGPAFVRTSTLCTSGAGSVGVCRGDSGGPLLIQRQGQRTLIGISSFVARNQCEGGYPSAFARVTTFVNFIRQHM